MADIATPTELASFLQVDVDTATATLLLELAQGLVVERIGAHDTWPPVAKAVVLAVVARAYVNPDGVRQRTAGGTTDIYNSPLYTNGVFLSESEVAQLSQWSNRSRGRLGTIRVGSGYPPISTGGY